LQKKRERERKKRVFRTLSLVLRVDTVEEEFQNHLEVEPLAPAVVLLSLFKENSRLCHAGNLFRVASVISLALIKRRSRRGFRDQLVDTGDFLRFS